MHKYVYRRFKQTFKYRGALSSDINVVILIALLSVVLTLYTSLKIISLTGSPAKQSLAVFIYNALYSFNSFLWKRVKLDRNSLIRLYVILLFGLLMASIIISLSTDFYVILLALSAFSITISILNPLSLGVFSKRIKRESEISLKWNYYNSLGSTVGYVLAGLLTEKINIAYFIVVIALLVLSYGLRITRLIEYDAPRVFTNPIPQHGSLNLFIEIFDKITDVKSDIIYLKRFIRKLSLNLKRRYYLTLLGIFVFFIGVGLFFTPLPSLLTLMGLKRTEIYLEYAAINIFSIIGFVILGKLNLTYEKMYSNIIFFTTIRAAIFLLPAIILSGLVKLSLLPVLLVISLVGFTWAFLGTTMLGVLLYIVPPYERARIASTFNAISSFGIVLGSLLTTLVVKGFGISYSYYLSSLLISVSLFLFLKAKNAVLS